MEKKFTASEWARKLSAARTKKLSPERRAAIASKAGRTRWAKVRAKAKRFDAYGDT